MSAKIPSAVTADRAKALPFDCLWAKVQIPAPRPGSITRTAVVNRLRSARSVSVIAVAAPAGYGKTTALAQWANRDERPFAWVTLDERDNDPIVLLRHVAAALDGCSPLPPSVLRALRSPGDSVWTTAVPRLACGLASIESPCVLVLDGSSCVHSEASAEVISVLAQHLSDGSTLVLAGRGPSPVPLAPLRTSGRLLDVGADVLALSEREAEALLEASGVDLSDEQVATLVGRTEGWAAGLYLAALAIRDAGASDAAAFAGDDRYLSDFFRSECLFALEPKRLAFLRRTSILERLSGPLCDAVLETTDSARELDAIDEAGLFLVRLDRSGSWFRYHGLFRDVLRNELEHSEPELVPLLHRRAADWLEAHGDWDAALGHAAEGQDVDRAAAILGARGFAECDAGRIAAVERWLDLFDVEALARHTELALVGAWWHALRGRTAEAERWLRVADSGAEPNASTGPSSALVHAALCREGVERMRADAEAAISGLAATDRRRPLALLLLGAAQALLGDGETADDTLERAVDESSVHRAPATGAAALAFRVLVASARGDHETADRLAFRARSLLGANPPAETGLGALVAVVAGRALLRCGRWDEAGREIAAAASLAPTLTDSLPWLSAQVYLELAEAQLTLRDTERARTHLAEAEAILRRRPGLGVIVGNAERLHREVAAQQAPPGRATRLTGAELRLLPLLATHLSFPEIGSVLFISRNTVKTEALSIYRKFGVASRSNAVGRAAALGLLDDRTSAVRPAAQSIDTARRADD